MATDLTPKCFYKTLGITTDYLYNYLIPGFREIYGNEIPRSNNCHNLYKPMKKEIIEKFVCGGYNRQIFWLFSLFHNSK